MNKIEKEIMDYRKHAPLGCVATSKWGTQKQRRSRFKKKQKEFWKKKRRVYKLSKKLKGGI